MSSLRDKLGHRISLSKQRWKNNRLVIRLARQVNSTSPLHELTRHGSTDAVPKPVAFFNASTRLTRDQLECCLFTACQSWTSNGRCSRGAFRLQKWDDPLCFRH